MLLIFFTEQKRLTYTPFTRDASLTILIRNLLKIKISPPTRFFLPFFCQNGYIFPACRTLTRLNGLALLNIKLNSKHFNVIKRKPGKLYVPFSLHS